jgi:hypothetical protein
MRLLRRKIVRNLFQSTLRDAGKEYINFTAIDS